LARKLLPVPLSPTRAKVLMRLRGDKKSQNIGGIIDGAGGPYKLSLKISPAGTAGGLVWQKTLDQSFDV
jgi:hypothetical protein